MAIPPARKLYPFVSALNTPLIADPDALLESPRAGLGAACSHWSLVSGCPTQLDLQRAPLRPPCRGERMSAAAAEPFELRPP